MTGEIVPVALLENSNITVSLNEEFEGDNGRMFFNTNDEGVIAELLPDFCFRLTFVVNCAVDEDDLYSVE